MSQQMSQTRGLALNQKSTNYEDTPINKGPSIKIQKDHPIVNFIGNLNGRVIVRFRYMISSFRFISKIKPKNIKEALTNELWINNMQEELCQLKRNNVWELVPRLENVNVIGTKWIYKNKYDEHDNVTRSNEKLVSHEHTQT